MRGWFGAGSKTGQEGPTESENTGVEEGARIPDETEHGEESAGDRATEAAENAESDGNSTDDDEARQTEPPRDSGEVPPTTEEPSAGSGRTCEDAPPGGDADAIGDLAARMDDVVQRLDAVGSLVQTRIDDVFERFDKKLLYDESKERQINRLHQELQGYKSDLVRQAVLPLVKEIIEFHAEIGRLIPEMRNKTEDEFPRDQIFKRMEQLQEDVELLLEHHDVEAYRAEPGIVFDPRLHTMLRTNTIPTDDPGLSGIVKDCTHPGFRYGERIVEKARVVVYKFQAARPPTQAGPGPEAATAAGGDQQAARDQLNQG